MAPGALRLYVTFEAPAVQKPDSRYGPATRLLVSATPPELLHGGEGAGGSLSRLLRLDPAVPTGVLHFSATAASCDDPGNLHPACHLHQPSWTIPVRLTEAGADSLPLVPARPDDD